MSCHACVKSLQLLRPGSIGFDEDATKDFSRSGFWYLIDEFDKANFFEESNLAGYEFHDQLAAYVIVPHHIGLWHFAGLIIRAGDHRGINNGRMRQQNSFELCGRNLESLVLDQFFCAINDEEVSVIVRVTDVTGVEPAVGIDSVSG